MTPVIYSLGVCPNCEKLKSTLKELGIEFIEKNMEDKESMYEMRYRACFAQEAPVLMTDTLLYESKDLFGADGNVRESVIADLIYDRTHFRVPRN